MKATIAIGAALALVRIWIGWSFEPEPFQWVQLYKDAAHLFVGGLAVAWWYSRQRWQWRLFWGLNLVEVATAALSRL